MDYYPDPDGEPGTRCWMCGWKSAKKNKKLGLKTHVRRKKHGWTKRRSCQTERKEIKKDKLKAAQNRLPKVKWGEEVVANCWQFPYLGSLFQSDGDQMPDIRARCAMAKTRAGTLRYIWASKLPIDLKLRLYIACCCSILVWGSEAWMLNEEACKCINGTNAHMLAHITNKTKREEATPATTTFNILAWIRARRLRWVGHILRLKDRRDRQGKLKPRLIKETLKVIFDNRKPGDILMDVDIKDWDELLETAKDKDVWKDRVTILCTAAQRTTKARRAKVTSYVNRDNAPRATRFTFYPHKMAIASKKTTKAAKKKTKTLSNAEARAKYYERMTSKWDKHDAMQQPKRS